MNNDLFKTRYSNKLMNGDCYHNFIQKDGFVYCQTYPIYKTNLVVLDDVTYSKEVYNNEEHSRAYDGVLCVDFLDKDVMIKDVYDRYNEYNCSGVSYFNNNYGIENINTDRFNFNIVDLSKEYVIKNLRKIFYYLQPRLQSHTLLGGGESDTETDPNWYSGKYYLKNGNEYVIKKHKKIVKFYATNNIEFKEYNNSIGDKSELLLEEQIDFDLYSKAIKLRKLKNNLSDKSYDLSNNDTNKLKEIVNEIEELDKYLSNIFNESDDER